MKDFSLDPEKHDKNLDQYFISETGPHVCADVHIILNIVVCVGTIVDN